MLSLGHLAAGRAMACRPECVLSCTTGTLYSPMLGMSLPQTTRPCMSLHRPRPTQRGERTMLQPIPQPQAICCGALPTRLHSKQSMAVPANKPVAGLVALMPGALPTDLCAFKVGFSKGSPHASQQVFNTRTCKQQSTYCHLSAQRLLGFLVSNASEHIVGWCFVDQGTPPCTGVLSFARLILSHAPHVPA